MKKKAISLLLIAACTMCGCSIVDMTTDKEVTEDKAPYKETGEENEDKVPVVLEETDYRVISYFDEKIDSIPVTISELDSYDDGVVRSYYISYEDETLRYDKERDRFFIGTFLFKEDEIYVITDKDNIAFITDYDVTSEQDFIDSGILVYSDQDCSDELSGFNVELHNDGYLCKFKLSNSKVETGYYMEYVFNSDKDLVYYRSGYGAENKPIEITLNTVNDVEDAFSNAIDVELTQEDFALNYKGLELRSDTSYQEIIDTLDYPEKYMDADIEDICSVTEDCNCLWPLKYPDQTEYDFEVKINIICPPTAFGPEDPDSYIDVIYSSLPTIRGISVNDSIYSLAKIYGVPDDIRESDTSGCTDVVYEFEGNELIFTIMPDNTIRLMIIDFA